jgi:cell division septation protein DedD
LVSLEARYPSDEEEQAETEGRTAFDYLPSHGIWVALATFIPTFLAVVIGVPHFLTFALAPHATEPRVSEAPLSATMALTASSTPTGLPADLRPVFLAPSVPSGTEERSRPTTLVDEAPTPRPSLETTELAASPKPTAIGPKAPKPAPAEDSAWAPAAAFADNQTAARLASTMRNQGYRMDVRHEDSATRPWVVWIKANAQNRRADEARPAPGGSRR